MGQKRSRSPHDRTEEQIRHEEWLQVVSDIRREIFVEGKPMSQVEAKYKSRMPPGVTVSDVVAHRVHVEVY